MPLSRESSSIINVFHFIPALRGRREKLGLKANLGRRMDLTLNIYPEVRIGLEPNLRQIEFRFFLSVGDFSTGELERGKHWFDAVLPQALRE